MPAASSHKVSLWYFFIDPRAQNTQQDYCDPQYSTILHSYCTLTYTEVTALFLWSISTVTMQYLHNFSVGLPVWVLQGNSGASSKKQQYYFCVGTSAVTV